MTRLAVLDRYKLSDDIDYSFRETPERALLRSILARAIYDLTPEASFEDRRNAIRWFRERPKLKLTDDDVTTWQNIKSELNLGCHALGLIDEVLKDAENFEEYRIKQFRNNKKIDINAWIESKNFHRELSPKRGGGPATIRYRKLSFVPRA